MLFTFNIQGVLKLKKNNSGAKSLKTEEMRVNTIVNQELRLNGEDIKISSDSCYLVSIVAENGGTSKEVNSRIGGSFSKLRKVWLNKSLRKNTKIKIFNAYVKSVLFVWM